MVAQPPSLQTARARHPFERDAAVSGPDVLVGVDVGSTRVKAVVVDLSGAELASAAAETPWVVDGHAVEMDAAALSQTVRTVIAARSTSSRRRSRDRRRSDQRRRVGRAARRHGEPAAPIIAWYDQRGDIELVAKELPDLVACTGVRFDPVATIFKLPELLRRGGGARWLNLAEWVVRPWAATRSPR